MSKSLPLVVAVLVVFCGVLAHAGVERFGQPVASVRVTRGYNVRVYNTRYRRYEYHTGIDYAGSKSTDILASNCGKVTLVQRNGQNDHGMGNCVVIEHQVLDGRKVYTLYAHMNSIDGNISVGASVKKGQVVGKMGGTGYGKSNYWATHLHFEFKSASVLHNPTGGGPYWGYTPTSADNYGYFDPNAYIGKVDAVCGDSVNHAPRKPDIISPNGDSISIIGRTVTFRWRDNGDPDGDKTNFVIRVRRMGGSQIFDSGWSNQYLDPGEREFRWTSPETGDLEWMVEIGDGRLSTPSDWVGFRISDPPQPKPWAAEHVDHSPYPTMVLGGSAHFWIILKNVGANTWYRDGLSPTPVNLGTSHPRDRVPGFVREDIVNHSPSGWIYPNRVVMQESVVPPGSYATFSFWMSALPEHETGVFREYFQLVADNAAWFEPDLGIYWDVTVVRPKPWAAEHVAHSPYPTIPRGGSAHFWITVRNVGTNTWYRDGLSPTPVNLGTSHPRDRVPDFVREDIVNHSPSGWIKPNRVVMQESVVPPGATATFSFWMSALPEHETGVFREYFQLVADNAEWFEPDMGIYWDVTVQ